MMISEEPFVIQRRKQPYNAAPDEWHDIKFYPSLLPL